MRLLLNLVRLWLARRRADKQAELLRQEVEALCVEVRRHTAFAEAVSNTQASAMAQWVTEVISRQMGFGIAASGLTPSWRPHLTFPC